MLSMEMQAAPLPFEKVEEAVLSQFPKIIEQEEKIQALEGKLQKSQGAFDLGLHAKAKSYPLGKYDGKVGEVFLQKPLQAMNSSLSVGYKEGEGKFPTYSPDSSFEKIDHFFARFQLSLLRYRSIDESRADLWIAKNQSEIEKIKLSLKKQDVLIDANYVYWNWFYYLNKKKLYEELVQLNKDRLEAIKKSVEKNDLAAIYIDETRQYLFSFQGELAGVEGSLREIEAKFKMYIPQFEAAMTPTALDPSKAVLKEDPPTDVSTLVNKRPEFKMFDLLMENRDFDLQVSEQKILPKIDLALDYTKARESQVNPLEEGLLYVSIEVPLQRNLGKGDIQRSQAEKRILSAQRELTQRDIRFQIEQLGFKLKADTEKLKNAQLEADAGKKLQKAEWIKFRNGASDFFLINTRDMNYAKAQVKVLESFVDYQISTYQLKMWSQPLPL